MNEKERDSRTPGSKKTAKTGTIIAAAVFIIGLALFVSQYFEDRPKSNRTPSTAERKVPAVVTYSVKTADLASAKDYIGRVEAIQIVEVKSKVTGEIVKVHFSEGSIVKEGDILFTLDKQQYQATVDLREADLAKAEANYKWAQQYHQRLKSSDKRSVSASDIEAAESDVNQGKAAVAQAKASLRLAQIELGYTKIKSPITGRIGRAQFTKGNHITSATGPLATVVQTDPVRVTFFMPDRDYIDRIDAFNNSQNNVYKASLTLPNGDPYHHKGERDFEDNLMHTLTATIEMRLRFKNDRGILVPGTMVRVQTQPVDDHIALVMPQEGVMTDDQGDFVYLVDKNDIVRLKRIEIGKSVGQMAEIRSGLREGESVIVRGLQAVRPDIHVKQIQLNPVADETSPAEQAMESGYDLKTQNGEKL